MNKNKIEYTYKSTAVPQYNPIEDRFELIKDGEVIAFNNLSDAFYYSHKGGY